MPPLGDRRCTIDGMRAAVADVNEYCVSAGEYGQCFGIIMTGTVELCDRMEKVGIVDEDGDGVADDGDFAYQRYVPVVKCTTASYAARCRVQPQSR